MVYNLEHAAFGLRGLHEPVFVDGLFDVDDSRQVFPFVELTIECVLRFLLSSFESFLSDNFHGIDFSGVFFPDLDNFAIATLTNHGH